MIIPFEINRYLHSEDLKILDNYEENVLYKAESEFSSISVVESKAGRFLKFGDSYQSGVLNYKGITNNLPHMNYFFISSLLNPEIESVLILGMGSGYLINGLTGIFQHIKNIDIVEIDPDIIEIAEKYFDFNPDNRVNINIQDARVFVRNSKAKYDLIIMDLFFGDGIDYRFMTEEFLGEVKKRLSSKGIFTSNLFGSSDFNNKNLLFYSSLKTYKAVFNDVYVFPTINGNTDFYREILGLRHELSDLTNIIFFASNRTLNITKNEFVLRALKLKERYSLPEINNINKYTSDLLETDFNLSKVSVLKDESGDDLQFNLEKFKKNLYIDHVANSQQDKINPVDDERKSVES